MKDLLGYIAKNLVDDPGQVSVKESNGEKAILLELTVAADDMGKVIGKQGKIAKSIRTITKAAAAKEGKRVTVEIQK